MSDQQMEGRVETVTVVLVVPRRHVKIVKSALERAGKLDQGVKIMPEKREDQRTGSHVFGGEQEQDAGLRAARSFPRLEFDSRSGQYVDPAMLKEKKEEEESAASRPTSASQAILQDYGAADSFPRLEFDSSSGQYVDPAALRERKELGESATSGTFPVLRFDPVLGQYVEPAALHEKNQRTTDQFPHLVFDSVSGQYVEPSILDESKQQESETTAPLMPESLQESSSATGQFPALAFDSDSGQYVDPSVVERMIVQEQGATDQFPRLEFDSVSGHYVERSVIAERKTQESLGATDQFPRLEFDPASGQYVEPSMMQKREKQESGIEEERMCIPTTFPYTLDTNSAARNEDKHQLKSKVLDDLVLSYLFQDIILSYRTVNPNGDSATKLNNPLHRALKEALDNLPETMLSSLEITTSLLVSSFPEAYSVYKPLLLLPNNAFSSSSWTKLFSTHPTHSEILQPIWQHIAAAVGATHVAINSPIPLHASSEQSSSAEAQPNILRRPTDLRPIYGNFGPFPRPQTLSSPTKADFDSAFWVTTMQNGINQTWAPRYTMFSRGNIREKTRILNLPSVTAPLVAPYTAVDLYAGIGYFAFSYKKGGRQDIGKVLCWELNPWSVEGLRRGAEMDGWSCRVFTNDDLPGTDAEWEAFRPELETAKDADFWVFQTSNKHAEHTIRTLARHNTSLLSPIRHVNLGLLPSSTLSWPTAVRILNIEHGGWIHVHENVGAKDIVDRTREIALEFQKLVAVEEGDGVEKRRRVVVEHVEKVKTYAPGVVHVVFDVRIEGEKTVYV